MRTILFFDLPTLTSQNKKDYRKFVKEIKKLGFYMLQESVYVKMSLNQQSSEAVILKIKTLIPNNGSIIALTITEKQFSQMNILLGHFSTDVINNDERIVLL